MQAINKVSKESTVKISTRNAASSPLLRLPGEIREQILLNVFGKQKIHIVHVVLVKPERVKKVAWHWRGPYNCASKLPSGYHHRICRADTYHNEAVTEDAVSATIPKEADSKFCQDCCKMEQDTWHTDRSGETIAQKCGWSQISLSILRASRQLYEEAKYLFWKNTTFAFTDGNSLEAFLQDLNHDQKNSLQHLELNATHVERYGIPIGASEADGNSFSSVSLGRLTRMLLEVGSLTSLDLHWTWSPTTALHKAVRTVQISKALTYTFRDLSILDVQQSNVTIREQAVGTSVFTENELQQLASNCRDFLIRRSRAFHENTLKGKTKRAQ